MLALFTQYSFFAAVVQVTKNDLVFTKERRTLAC